MKKIVIEQNPTQQGGAYLKIEDGKVLLGVWNESQESVMVLAPRDIAGIKAFMDGVTATWRDKNSPPPRPWHVTGTVHEVSP